MASKRKAAKREATPDLGALRRREGELESELATVRAAIRKAGGCRRCGGSGVVMLGSYPFGSDNCPDCT